MSTASVVRAEAAALLAAVVLLAAGVTSMPAIVGGAFGVAALGFARADGRPLVAWAGLAVGYVARPKTWVVPADQPRGHRRRRMRSAAPADAVTALLPGAVLVDVHDRDRRMFAILAWRDFRAVVLAVDAPADPIVSLSQPVRVPLPDLTAVRARPELSLHSVQVVSEAWPVRPLAAIGHLGTTVARRRTFVTVAATVENNEAIAARGGGSRGTTRLMAAAAQRVQLALALAGAASHPLTATELRAAVASSAGLHHGLLRERWSDVTTSAGRHRTFAVEMERAATNAIDALVAPAAEVVTTRVVLDGSTARCTARVTAAGPDELDTATDQLAQAAARAGLRLRSQPGVQLAGLRATLPIGAVEC